MPATISTRYLGSCEKELQEFLTDALRSRPEDWRVSLIGSQSNEAWEIITSAPDGRRWKDNLEASGEHCRETVLRTIEVRMRWASEHPVLTLEYNCPRDGTQLKVNYEQAGSDSVTISDRTCSVCDWLGQAPKNHVPGSVISRHFKAEDGTWQQY